MNAGCQVVVSNFNSQLPYFTGVVKSRCQFVLEF